ncbi:Txe/YoeB family addiction module toxin [Lunatimonas salinarum]|uniref:Txe/YoeB family addiction module toxin n=1 Tax=Lunatimonas salinarum TaxID=1774590 RepID=UPI001ADF58D7|nr:Txe/YoeB family addiction module toxin [Lunatimonas salinarum]
MTYQLEFSGQAIKDIEFHKNSGNKALLKKLFQLLEELTEHPTSGIGKPEQLKHNLAGYWSRRINQKHRLVYKILENETVRIYAAKGHY